MSTHTKLSVTVPTYLVGYIGREMESSGKAKSVVIAEALKSHYEPEAAGSVDGPTWEQFEALEARVSEIERVAQQNGAM